MTTVTCTETALPETGTEKIDLYRDIHKGLRNALFTSTFRVGRLDVADDDAVREVTTELCEVLGLLRGHHEHEEHPALVALLDAQVLALAVRVDEDHAALAVAMDDLTARVDELAAAPAPERTPIARELYLEFAAFTSAYLAHLDVEERQVMPALAGACANEELAPVLGAILASIPPDQKVVAMTRMLPAMNPGERTALLGQMRATIPPEIFERFRALAERVLTPSEYSRVATGLANG